MARNNRLIEMVFANVVGTEDRVSMYDKFVSTDVALKIEETKDLKEAKNLYSKIIAKNKVILDELAKLEESIV